MNEFFNGKHDAIETAFWMGEATAHYANKTTEELRLLAKEFKDYQNDYDPNGGAIAGANYVAVMVVLGERLILASRHLDNTTGSEVRHVV